MTDDPRGHIRQALTRHTTLELDARGLDDRVDLFDAGMSSHASVVVMLELEDTFNIEFPDQMMRRSVFETVDAIAAALATLGVHA